MCDSVETMAWPGGGYADGVWEPDWDDAAFYGPAYYSRAGWEEGRADYQARATEAVERNLALAEEGLSGPSAVFVNTLTELLYGVMGVIEYMDASGDTTPLPIVDASLDRANDLATMMGSYLTGFSNYAMDTYGPTVVTAMFAVANLQYAVLLDTPRRADRIETARALVQAIDANAWNGTFYEIDPTDPERTGDLFLYPNVVMMITLGRLHQATGEASFLERAEALYPAIEPLRCTDRPGYRSPYSAEAMGAQTDDYTTLSATSYAIFGFAILAEITGSEVYRQEIDTLLEFVADYLWVPEDGKIYHHWMDGRLALPTDLEYYCIGCNLQVLYVVWWIDHHLGA